MRRLLPWAALLAVLGLLRLFPEPAPPMQRLDGLLAAPPRPALWRRLLPWLGGLAVIGGAAAWLLSASRPAFGEADAGIFETGSAERGRLVFHAADCGSCHASPGQPDPLALGGGMALAGPPGVFRPPNISSHPRDGIGAWRGIDIANAVMSGVSPDGRHYYPALPYIAYAGMAVQDMADLVAYLRSLPAVEGRPPPHELPFPFTIRRSVGLWKLLFFHPAPVPPEPRGRYLVEAIAHCAECHSSRNLAGAIREDTRFAGGPDPEGTGWVPNITPGGRVWRRQALLDLLTTGIMPDGRLVGGSMADVVRNLSQLPLADREAIADYVLALPPRPTPSP